MVTWLSTIRNQRLALRALWLTLAVVAEFALIGPVAVCLGGVPALAAAAVAGLLCLVGAMFALVTSYLLRGPQFVLLSMLVGMALRLTIPLAPAIVLHFRGGPLAGAGLLYYLVAFYLVTLTVETVLSLPLRESPTDPASEH
jgi:hypothetical protein